jgi:hypothetical protein
MGVPLGGVVASCLVILKGYWVNKVIRRTARIDGGSYLPFVGALHTRFSNHLYNSKS